MRPCETLSELGEAAKERKTSCRREASGLRHVPAYGMGPTATTHGWWKGGLGGSGKNTLRWIERRGSAFPCNRAQKQKRRKYV